MAYYLFRQLCRKKDTSSLPRKHSDGAARYLVFLARRGSVLMRWAIMGVK
jgi:hypothetical protein